MPSRQKRRRQRQFDDRSDGDSGSDRMAAPCYLDAEQQLLATCKSYLEQRLKTLQEEEAMLRARLPDTVVEADDEVPAATASRPVALPVVQLGDQQPIAWRPAATAAAVSSDNDDDEEVAAAVGPATSRPHSQHSSAILRGRASAKPDDQGEGLSSDDSSSEDEDEKRLGRRLRMLAAAERAREGQRVRNLPFPGT